MFCCCFDALTHFQDGLGHFWFGLQFFPYCWILVDKINCPDFGLLSYHFGIAFIDFQYGYIKLYENI